MMCMLFFRIRADSVGPRSAKECSYELRVTSPEFRVPDKIARSLRQCRIAQREMQRRLDQAELVAAIVARAGEAISIDLLLGEQRGDRVSELDFAARAGRGLFEQLEDATRQHV